MVLRPGNEGGNTAAPGSYSKVGAVSTLKQISGSQTVDAVRMTVRDNVYGVVFSFTVPKSQYDSLGWETIAGQYASTVQNYGALDGTQAIQYVQDTNAANELIDTLIVTVGTDDGLVSIDVQVPLTNALDSSYSGVIEAAYQAGVANLVTLS